MRKSNYFLGSLIPLLFLFCVLGCRNENIYSVNSSISQKEAILRQVNKRDIPNIMNFLATKTDGFKLPLKTSNALGKTETVFGEVDTNYIIESNNGNGEIYFVFSIMPDVSDSKTYNIEIKSDGTTPLSAKIIVYYPTEDWVLNGNGDFSIFSGRAYTYSLDGILETSVDFLRGAAGPCDPNPCPDCPINPHGPGGNTGGSGSGGGGGPIGGGGPTGGEGPTGSGGPVAYPPFGPGTGNPSPGDTGSTSGGANCQWTCIYDENDECTKMECVTATNQNRIINPCGGGQVVVYTAPMYLNDVMNNLRFPLTPTEKNFLNLYSNSSIANGLRSYLNNNLNQDGATFVKWSIAFFLQNPNINWVTFERVFLTPKVIEDGGENFDIARYSTIQVQKFTLPTFSSVNQHFPRDPNNPVYGMPSSQVYKLVGGNMYTQNINGNPNYQNACAIRVSRALNYAGQSVPVFFNDSGQQKSEKGSDTKNYILTAEAMLAYMIKAYPSPTYSYTGNDLKSVYNEIKGKNGIYIIIPKVRSELGASGHADLFYTNDCLVGGCHLGLPSGGSVYFWELK